MEEYGGGRRGEKSRASKEMLSKSEGGSVVVAAVHDKKAKGKERKAASL